MNRSGRSAWLRPGAIGLAICLRALCLFAEAPAAREPLDLGDRENGFGCLSACGELVVLVKPGVGAVILSLAEFPGAELVGTIAGKEARFSIPGLRMPEQSITSRVDYAPAVPLWGRTVADVESGGQPGCFALERPASGNAEDLATEVRRRAAER